MKEISLERYNLLREIIVFEDSRIIWICGKDYQMKSILSCSFIDKGTTVKGQTTSTTKTDNADTIKRAIVGDALLGGVGAVVGGSTAIRSTVTTHEEDKFYHDYTIILNIDSLSDPIIRVHIGRDESTMNEIIGVMNVIISRK